MNRLAHRRNMVKALLAGVGLTGLGSLFAQSSVPPRRVVQMVARRFVYEPSEIKLKAGEPVVVEIRSIDFVHGMNIPDLNKRLDLVPGQVARLEFTPQGPGVIEFVCDNFCGDGHEEMHGRFVVAA